MPTESDIINITVNADDDINIAYMIEDLHAFLGNPYVSNTYDLPDGYKEYLFSLASKLVEAGWKKEEF